MYILQNRNKPLQTYFTLKHSTAHFYEACLLACCAFGGGFFVFSYRDYQNRRVTLWVAELGPSLWGTGVALCKAAEGWSANRNRSFLWMRNLDVTFEGPKFCSWLLVSEKRNLLNWCCCLEIELLSGDVHFCNAQQWIKPNVNMKKCRCVLDVVKIGYHFPEMTKCQFCKFWYGLLRCLCVCEKEDCKSYFEHEKFIITL